MKTNTVIISWGIILFLYIVFLSILAIMQPSWEAKEFNRCTGGNATYWTALNTKLRIDSCNK